ncbi:MAG: hypothetical protein JWO78_553 [Micavibrio sp.]|nr:hypothetical protein [Micavibrio sp.]
MDELKKETFRLEPSIIVLIIANLIPVYGVVFLGWNVLDILLVFWVENLAIGLFTILKMLTVGLIAGGIFRLIGTLFRICFFCAHYGLFTLGHGVLIYAIFGDGPFTKGAIKAEYWPSLYEPFLPGHALFYAALSILGSHLFSYVYNFIIRKEYASSKVDILMFRPYGRVVILHIVILLGGFLAEKSGSSIAALLLLVVIKICIDIVLHRQIHKPIKTTVSL